MITSDVLADKFAAVRATLTERGLRLWAAAEARSLGHGGIKMTAISPALAGRPSPGESGNSPAAMQGSRGLLMPADGKAVDAKG